MDVNETNLHYTGNIRYQPPPSLPVLLKRLLCQITTPHQVKSRTPQFQVQPNRSGHPFGLAHHTHQLQFFRAMAAHKVIRKYVDHLGEDRPLYHDHNKMKELVRSCEILEEVEKSVGSLG